MIRLSRRGAKGGSAAAERGLAGAMIPRAEPRRADNRCEPRLAGVANAALLHFRGEDHSVAVANLSSRGAMIETALQPRIGERVLIQFPECSRMEGYVRWVRDGRVGVNFGYVMTLVG